MREAGSALSRNGIWASELFQGPQGSSLSLMKPPQPPWGVRRRPSRVSDQHCRWGSPGPHRSLTTKNLADVTLPRVQRAFRILSGLACSQNHPEAVCSPAPSPQFRIPLLGG